MHLKNLSTLKVICSFLISPMLAPAALAENAGWYIGGGTKLVQPNDAGGTIKNFDATALSNNRLNIADIEINFPNGTTLNSNQSQDFDITFSTGAALNFNVGFDFAGPLRAELDVNWQEHDIDSITLGDAESDSVKGKTTAFISTVNLWYDFLPTRQVHPYIGFGLGAADMSYEAGEDTLGISLFGAGLNVPLNRRTSIDIAYRYYYSADISFSSEETGGARGDIETLYRSNGLGINLRYNFFQSDKNNLGMLDNDGDGISNHQDRCSATPLGAIVNQAGCPQDSDGDRVWNGIDQCQNSPSETPVNEMGCTIAGLLSPSGGSASSSMTSHKARLRTSQPSLSYAKDADQDSVENALDMCANTPANAIVLPNGCSNGQSIVLDGVNFKGNSSEMTLAGQTALYKVFVALRRSPNYVMEIQGHTDNRGSSAYNLELSEARANTVANFLIQLGINPNRLFAKAYGESQPIASNQSPAGQARNRRVELKIEIIGS